MNDDITDIDGLQVGHYTDETAVTGCTVLLCPDGAVGGVSLRGSAPGTRETELLRPGMHVEKVHAILLSGGSAFGLDAAGGVMRYLDEQGIGYQTRAGKVPIVPAAIIYDLGIGDSKVRPGPQEGYQACKAAGPGLIMQGSAGAGTGATAGKALGPESAVKGGIGSASLKLPDGTVVAALMVVNAVGDVVEHATGRLVAGSRHEGGMRRALDLYLEGRAGEDRPREATTIGVVATNAVLTKEQVNKLAAMADDGVALAVRPAHGMGDGDVLFALATGGHTSRFSLTALGALAAEIVARAIVRAVTEAKGLGGIPAVSEL